MVLNSFLINLIYFDMKCDISFPFHSHIWKYSAEAAMIVSWFLWNATCSVETHLQWLFLDDPSLLSSCSASWIALGHCSSFNFPTSAILYCCCHRCKKKETTKKPNMLYINIKYNCHWYDLWYKPSEYRTQHHTHIHTNMLLSTCVGSSVVMLTLALVSVKLIWLLSWVLSNTTLGQVRKDVGYGPNWAWLDPRVVMQGCWK